MKRKIMTVYWDTQMNEENINRVGCRRCREEGVWTLFSDGKKIVKAICVQCAHEVFLEYDPIKTQPDEKVYDLRMFL